MQQSWLDEKQPENKFKRRQFACMKPARYIHEFADLSFIDLCKEIFFFHIASDGNIFYSILFYSILQTAFIPEKESYGKSKAQLLAAMDVAMGGRVGEEVIYGQDKVTTGRSSRNI